MAGFREWLDEYERSARLAPGLIALLPAVIVVFSLGLRSDPAIAAALGVLGTIGMPLLLTSVVRQRGLDAQASLWRDWGGSPTVQSLRHESTVATATQRAHWRRAIERCTGVRMPTEAEEHDDRSGTDDTYALATSQLIEQTRDREAFPLVAAEGKSYGFARNLYGMRTPAIAVSLIALAVLAGSIVLERSGDLDVRPVDLYVGAVVDVVLLLVWIVIVTGERVRIAGFRYADRLLASADRVERDDGGNG
jgi:hypothetical protein